MASSLERIRLQLEKINACNLSRQLLDCGRSWLVDQVSVHMLALDIGIVSIQISISPRSNAGFSSRQLLGCGCSSLRFWSGFGRRRHMVAVYVGLAFCAVVDMDQLVQYGSQRSEASPPRGRSVRTSSPFTTMGITYRKRRTEYHVSFFFFLHYYTTRRQMKKNK